MSDKCCPSCGQSLPLEGGKTFKRGPFLAKIDPNEVFYKGIKLRLSPREAALMALLVRRRTISLFAAEMVATGEETKDSRGTMKVVVSNLRRKLTQADPDLCDAIVSLFGQGLHLEVPKEAA